MRRRVITDGTHRNEQLESICVKTQSQLKKYLENKLKRLGRSVENGDGYLYSPGSIPIMLTAHMDTVHKEQPSVMLYEKGRLSSPQGIGGDDRCGVYMILKVIADYDCHVLFCEDEETGGVGSDKFVRTQTCKDLVGKINYVIELDRKGKNDAVYYDCDNRDFCDFVEDDFWEREYGTFSDIGNICPELKCAGVNLSCGYYKQHTTEEYIVLDEMERAITEVKKLIEVSDDTFFEYIEAKHSLYGGSLYSYLKYRDYGYGYEYDDDYGYSYSDMLEHTYEFYWVVEGVMQSEAIYGVSEEEAVGWFLINHPSMCYNQILNIVRAD